MKINIWFYSKLFELTLPELEKYACTDKWVDVCKSRTE